MTARLQHRGSHRAYQSRAFSRSTRSAIGSPRDSKIRSMSASSKGRLARVPGKSVPKIRAGGGGEGVWGGGGVGGGEGGGGGGGGGGGRGWGERGGGRGGGGGGGGGGVGGGGREWGEGGGGGGGGGGEGGGGEGGGRGGGGGGGRRGGGGGGEGGGGGGGVGGGWGVVECARTRGWGGRFRRSVCVSYVLGMLYGGLLWVCGFVMLRVTVLRVCVSLWCLGILSVAVRCVFGVVFFRWSTCALVCCCFVFCERMGLILCDGVYDGVVSGSCCAVSCVWCVVSWSCSAVLRFVLL
jgi:hypothetical protein